MFLEIAAVFALLSILIGWYERVTMGRIAKCISRRLGYSQGMMLPVHNPNGPRLRPPPMTRAETYALRNLDGALNKNVTPPQFHLDLVFLEIETMTDGVIPVYRMGGGASSKKFDNGALDEYIIIFEVCDKDKASQMGVSAIVRHTIDKVTNKVDWNSVAQYSIVRATYERALYFEDMEWTEKEWKIQDTCGYVPDYVLVDLDYQTDEKTNEPMYGIGNVYTL